MRKIVKSCAVLSAIVLCMVSMYGCGDKKKAENSSVMYKDGTYEAESKPDSFGGKVVVHITIKDSKISEVTMENLDNNGNEKGEDYGKQDGEIKNEGLYKIAQDAVNNTKEYPAKLMETQDIEKVDAIAGATESNVTFKDAVNKALEKAK